MCLNLNGMLMDEINWLSNHIKYQTVKIFGNYRKLNIDEFFFYNLFKNKI